MIIEKTGNTASVGSDLPSLFTTSFSSSFSAHHSFSWSGFSTTVPCTTVPCTLFPSFVIYDPCKSFDLIRGPCSSLSPCLHHQYFFLSILVPPFLVTMHANSAVFSSFSTLPLQQQTHPASEDAAETVFSGPSSWCSL